MLTSQDLLGRGWTKRAIGKWLSQPDRIEEFPSHGRWSRTRHWYDEARVEAVEATADWQAFAEKRADRSAAAKKAATTRHANTVAWADQVEIRIDLDDFDWAELEELALDAQSAWQCERGHTGDVHGAPENVKHRWTMNYIRHELTNYEEILASLRGATGGSDVPLSNPMGPPDRQGHGTRGRVERPGLIVIEIGPDVDHDPGWAERGGARNIGRVKGPPLAKSVTLVAGAPSGARRPFGRGSRGAADLRRASA